MALKDKIKAASRTQKRDVVEFDAGDGTKFAAELRAPSMLEKSEIFRLAGGADAESAEDAQKLVRMDLLGAQLVIHCLYDPETDDRVYTQADLPEVLKLGSVLDQAQIKAMELYKPPADPAGKSVPTPS